MGYKRNHHQYQLFSELEDGDKIYRIQLNNKLDPAHAQIERVGNEAFVDFGRVRRAGITNPFFECRVSGALKKSDSEVLDEAILQILTGGFQ